MKHSIEHYIKFSSQSIKEFENCWKFVQYFLNEEFDIHIPEYSVSLDDPLVIADSIRRQELMNDWIEVVTPRCGDVVMFLIHGRRPHIGVMVDACKVMHYKNNMMGAVIESVDNSSWRNKVEGYYRNGKSACNY